LLFRSRQTALGAPVRLLAVVAFVGLVVLFYAGSLHSAPSNSDNATLALQGQSLDHGNLLLNHWNLSSDSFWTLDVLFNAVAYALVGLRPADLFIVPAVVAALVVVAGVAITRDNRAGAAAAATAGGLVVAAVLAFPTHALAYFYLHGGLHIATALYALVAFYALRRGRFGWGWAVAVVVMAAATLGDIQAIPYGTIPLLLAGLVAIARLRSWRGGTAQISAAVGALLLAEVGRQIAERVGTFGEATINPRAPFAEMKLNVRHLLSVGANLLGVRNQTFGTGGVPGWLHVFREVMAAVLVICFLVALVRLLAGAVAGQAGGTSWWQSEDDGWRLDDMLVIATFGPACMFILLTLSISNAQFSRYLTATVIFAAVLAGRVVAGWVTRTRFAPLAVGTSVAATALVLSAAVTTGYTLSVAAPPQPAGHLAKLLRRHRLTVGLGDYWSSSITTVQSRGQARVRPVITGPNGELEAYERESEKDWYGGSFQFLVMNAIDGVGAVDMKSAVASWGRPAHVYHSGIYSVAVWSKPVSLALER
jgi:hypothetical protein